MPPPPRGVLRDTWAIYGLAVRRDVERARKAKNRLKKIEGKKRRGKLLCGEDWPSLKALTLSIPRITLLRTWYASQSVVRMTIDTTLNGVGIVLV